MTTSSSWAPALKEQLDIDVYPGVLTEPMGRAALDTGCRRPFIGHARISWSSYRTTVVGTFGRGADDSRLYEGTQRPRGHIQEDLLARGPAIVIEPDQQYLLRFEGARMRSRPSGGRGNAAGEAAATAGAGARRRRGDVRRALMGDPPAKLTSQKIQKRSCALWVGCGHPCPGWPWCQGHCERCWTS